MLEGFARAAAFDEFAQGIGLRGREGAVEIEVQFHARHFEEMGEEEFRLQARGLDIFFAEEIGAFLDRFEDGHGREFRAVEIIAQPF